MRSFECMHVCELADVVVCWESVDDDLCGVYVHLFTAHDRIVVAVVFFWILSSTGMVACLLHGPFFTSKSSSTSHVRFSIKNVNLLQVVLECIEQMPKQNTLSTDKITNSHEKVFSFAYDWSRWHILNMAFKFLFILAAFGRLFWVWAVSGMSVPLFLFSMRSDFLFASYVFFS